MYGTEMNLDEFFEKFELDWSAFGQRIFMIMDASGDHRLDFSEFFTGMWNYCTLNREDLEKFAFDLFDSSPIFATFTIFPASFLSGSASRLIVTD